MERLKDGEATDFERFLLDSAEDEAPSPELRNRVLAGLGVAAAAAAAASTGQSAASGALTGGAGGASGAGGVGLAAASGAVKAVVLKVVLVLAAVGAGAGLAGVALRMVSDSPAARAPEPMPVVVEALPVVPGPSVEVPAAPPEGITAAPPERVAPRRKARDVAMSPRASASVQEPLPAKESTVASEVAALDRARSALSAGDPARTLSELVKYDAAFPNGALRQEKTMLEVRALLAAGQRQNARRRVDAFLAAHPDSAQAARLRSLVE
jgi:hypothetical protein